jgi:hypothetical protein
MHVPAQVYSVLDGAVHLPDVRNDVGGSLIVVGV